MEADAPLLSVRGLGKVYPNGHRALADVDLDLEAGSFLVVIGLSGSGKSTLLRCLNRLVEPTEGQVCFRGRDVTHVGGADLRRVRARLAMVFQHFNLVRRASVLTNVLTGALERTPIWRSVLGLWPAAAREEARRCLDRVGLLDLAARRADTLSGGQQQRVAIARALMQQPEVILADEPVASLDPATSHAVLDHLETLRETHGLTIVANLHFLGLARRYGTRVVALKAGRLVFDGRPDEITDERFRAIYGDDATPMDLD